MSEIRATPIRWLSWISSLLLLVVLVLFNLVFARASVRVDLTEEGRYTLSDSARAILGRLEDPAVVKVFWQDVPLKFDHTKRYVQALLEEMKAEAGEDRFQVQWVDMEEEEGKAAAAELGVEQYLFGAQHGAEIRESKGYMSLTIELGNEKPEVLNALSQIEDELEYRIASTIYQRTAADRPVIGLVTDKPPFNPFAGGAQRGRFTDFETTLRKAFGTSARMSVSLDFPVEEDVKVLIVAGPRAMPEKQAYHLEQFLLRGGRVLLLLDPADIDNVLGRASQKGDPHLSGLEDWLTYVGVTAERGTVADYKAHCLAPIGGVPSRYPYWPKVHPAFVDRSNPVTRYLQAMALYWPAAISVDQKLQEAEGRTATILATSTDSGFRRGDLTGLQTVRDGPEGKLLEKVPLIALVEGPLKSFWTGKPIPGTEPEGDGSDLPSGPGADGGGEDKGAEGKGAEGKGAEGKGAEDKGAEDEGAGDEGAGDGQPATGSPDGDAPPAPPVEPGKKEDAAKDAPKDDGKDEPRKAPPPPAKGSDGSDGDGDADAKEGEGAEEQGPPRLESGNIRMLVVGDAEMISDQFGPRFPYSQQINGYTGFSFVVNAAEWLGGGDDLLALRARSTNPRNLEQMEEDDRTFMKVLNLLLVPLLVLLAGITVFIIRRS
jgi:ABC-type uncharacterized transport system involved in gliding motility auxiliary subunit